ncbi:conserved hypothetical protein [Ricinus communis]|uniref:Uncharacterized protein n=1 Tax=Ricinus communis TaxID=3988 RepID=B9SFS7_RICCO|nr:conserved hypothetical protein [Ricinus communis]
MKRGRICCRAMVAVGLGGIGNESLMCRAGVGMRGVISYVWDYAKGVTCCRGLLLGSGELFWGAGGQQEPIREGPGFVFPFSKQDALLGLTFSVELT